jgi:hypothetical protein
VKRKVFDRLASIIGLGLAVLLFVAGGLLSWAHSFVGNEVHKELSNQQIYFPKAGDASLKALPASDAAAMSKYAGQQLTTGAQAETYADHYIAVHLNKIGGGKTYSQLSGQLQTLDKSDPNYAALSGQVDTMFKGETLRGLLLNAYAFGTMGTIAGIAAIAAWIGGAVLVVLSALGLRHASRVDDADEIVRIWSRKERKEIAHA